MPPDLQEIVGRRLDACAEVDRAPAGRQLARHREQLVDADAVVHADHERRILEIGEHALRGLLQLIGARGKKAHVIFAAQHPQVGYRHDGRMQGRLIPGQCHAGAVDLIRNALLPLVDGNARICLAQIGRQAPADGARADDQNFLHRYPPCLKALQQALLRLDLAQDQCADDGCALLEVGITDLGDRHLVFAPQVLVDLLQERLSERNDAAV